MAKTKMEADLTGIADTISAILKPTNIVKNDTTIPSIVSLIDSDLYIQMEAMYIQWS